MKKINNNQLNQAIQHNYSHNIFALLQKREEIILLLIY